MIGQTVSSYRVLERIGAGSFGEVYKAEHETLGIHVALKFIHPEKMSIPENRLRFSHEARAAAKLDHTSICKVFDYEEFERGAYIAMDFISGESLNKRIENGPLPLPEAVLMAIQVTQGLEEAHANGVIHRDIKPANLMVTKTGQGELQIKILDFGIARTIDTTRVTDTGEIIGTTTYMSPEQVQGKDLDHRTDLWSVGVCLYEMVTGKIPFGGDNPLAAQYAIVQTSPVPVGSLRPEALPELRRIINKALQKNPAKRYQTAGEMRTDLQNLLQEMTSDMNPVLTWMWKYRNRLALGSGAIFSLALVGFVILPHLQPKPEPNPFEIGQTRKVTHSDAWEAGPSLSPDGSRVAFTSNARGNSDIYWVGLAGGDPVQLTDDPADDSDPCWLPDGSAILFTSNRLGQSGIWKTDLTGQATSLLLEEGTQPAVSPDGLQIAFTRMDDHGTGRIFVVDLNNPADIVQLTGHEEGYWSHGNPAWSPDGTTICYGDVHNLWVIPARGGSARPITAGGSADDHPVYSGDGRYIFFSSFRDGTSALWRTDSDGSRLQKLTPGSGPESHPDLDRDGSRLVYSTQTLTGDIVITNYSSGQTTLMESPPRDIQPCLSPDGSLMAFVSTRWNRYADLWIQQLHEGEPQDEPVRLVEQQGAVAHPAVSPDNRWVAYYLIRLDTQSRDIWIAPIPAGRPIQITDHPAADVTPAWSPDGRTLAFGSDREGVHAIYTIAISEGQAVGLPTRITSLDLSTIYPSWSGDGTAIAFTAAKDRAGETWLVPSDGSGPARLLTHQANTYMARWVWDRHELWVCGKWGGSEYEIRRIDLNGGPAAAFNPPRLMGYANEFYPDRTGNLMVHTIEETKGDIWILEAEKETSF